MKNKNHIRFHAILFIFAGFYSSQLEAAPPLSQVSLKKFSPEQLFAISLQSPSLVRYCHSTLWAYSVQDKSLHKIDPQKGTLISSIPTASLRVEGLITALNCNPSGGLFLASQSRVSDSKKRKYFLYRWNTTPNTTAEALKIPKQQLIRDLFCLPKKKAQISATCFLIQNTISETTNFQHWTEKAIPPSYKVENYHHPETNPEPDPFDNWQDQFFISEGQYFHGGAFQATDEMAFFLDAMKATVVLRSQQHAEPEYRKWGEWGVWEGRLMSPKGITAILGNHFAISDVGLKQVFFFTRDGTFLNAIGPTEKTPYYGYPLDVSSDGQQLLFVADLNANKVYGYRLKESEGISAPTEDNLKGRMRKNLYRSPELLKFRAKTRCLNCHDGLQVNSLDRFIDTGKHHPVNVEVPPAFSSNAPPQIDLPLENGRLVSCATCHDAHHGAAQIEGDLPQKPIKNVTQSQSMLRKPTLDLCMSCHESKKIAASNHPIDAGNACLDCHGVHGMQDYLLKNKIPDLCVNCHGSDVVPKSHPFDPGMVNCLSCHSLHHSDPKQNLATHSLKGGPEATCGGCHSEKFKMQGKNSHLGKEPLFEHGWPKNEGACLDCHKPHAKKSDSYQTTCRQCHEDKKGVHKARISIAGTTLAKGIHFDNSKVSCVTCHDPHGENGSFFRETDLIFPFCAKCHGAKAEELYSEFHRKLK